LQPRIGTFTQSLRKIGALLRNKRSLCRETRFVAETASARQSESFAFSPAANGQKNAEKQLAEINGFRKALTVINPPTKQSRQ